MTSSGDIKNLLDDTLKAYGKVDILVNNAGIMHQVLTMSLDMAKDYDAIMNVSLRAYFETVAFIGGHIGKGGSIINIAVIGGLGGAHPVATYVASKAAVIPLTKSCAKEVAAEGMRVSAICPGVIFSEMMDPDSEFTKMSVSMVPMGRDGQPREIGTAASFLASDEASFVTGDCIVVDGGQTAWLARCRPGGAGCRRCRAGCLPSWLEKSAASSGHRHHYPRPKTAAPANHPKPQLGRKRRS